MNRTALLVAATFALAAGAGCSSSGGASPPPAPPSLGTQIDRMGRPAINTALNHTFDRDATRKGQAKDAYNANADERSWPVEFQAEIARNLAILDALDGVCGNQILAGAAPAAGRYNPLAAVLADDELWVNTAGATCSRYLAVELNATGVLRGMDCGGRKLADDVIDTTYSALAAGKLSGVGDGVAPGPVNVGSATFPYLSPPY